MPFEHLLVKPDSTVNLDQFETESDRLWSGDKESGKAKVKELAHELEVLQRVLFADGRRRVLVVLQAMDTGGKDSTIRDVFGRMNPQGVNVASFGVPTESELAHDYLWRVHPHVPGDGEIVIFNRSHYEDVLVVRVENLVSESRWRKRYQHIVDFERMLADEGTTIVKFFIHISKEEQKKRLESRLEDPSKHWKFNPSDLDTREKWDDYMAAYAEMLGRTSTTNAPWFVIPGDRKWYRKLVIGEVMVRLLGSLDLSYPDNADDLSDVTVE